MYLLTHLFLTTLQGRCFDYTHFIEEETEAQQLNNVPNVIQLGNDGVEIQTQAF